MTIQNTDYENSEEKKNLYFELLVHQQLRSSYYHDLERGHNTRDSYERLKQISKNIKIILKKLEKLGLFKSYLDFEKLEKSFDLPEMREKIKKEWAKRTYYPIVQL